MLFSGYPANGDKDFDSISSTNTTISTYAITIGGIPGSVSTAYAIIDTSQMTGVTTALTLAFRSTACSGPDATVDATIDLWDGTGYNVRAYRTTSKTTLNNRNVSTALTSSNQLNCINKSGGTETALKFSMSYPVSDGTNTWSIRAYEDPIGQTGATRLIVSFNPAVSSFKKRRAILIV